MGIREVMVIVGGKSVGDVVELLADGPRVRDRPDLSLPAGRARHRPRHRAGPRLRRRRRVLLRPRRQHPARPGAGRRRRPRSRPGPYGAGTLLYQVPDPERFGVAELDADGRVVGFEEKPDQPKSDLIPIGVYFLRPDAFDVIDTLLAVGRAASSRSPTCSTTTSRTAGLFSPIYEGHWTDAGTVPSLLRAAELAARRRCRGPPGAAGQPAGRPDVAERRRFGRLLVTGGAGFIGSCYVRDVLGRRDGTRITVLDKLTYAGNEANLAPVRDDLGDGRALHASCAATSPTRPSSSRSSPARDAVVNFAAESHVDRSILDPEAFLRDRRHRRPRPARGVPDGRRQAALPAGLDRRGLRLGRRGPRARGRRRSRRARRTRRPRRAGELLVRSYVVTHGVDAVVTRGSNTYGPYHHPEKLIPLFVTNALDDRPLPLYGDGLQRREWLYVSDHAAAIDHVLRHGDEPARPTTSPGRPNGRTATSSRSCSSTSASRGRWSCRSRTGRATTGATRWTARSSRRSAGGRGPRSRTGLAATDRLVPSPTRRGGARPGRATGTAGTSASTAAAGDWRCSAADRARPTDARRRHRARGRLGARSSTPSPTRRSPDPAGPDRLAPRRVRPRCARRRRRALDRDRPEVVVHAAAWTDVDGCALDPELGASRRNGDARPASSPRPAPTRGIDLADRLDQRGLRREPRPTAAVAAADREPSAGQPVRRVEARRRAAATAAASPSAPARRSGSRGRRGCSGRRAATSRASILDAAAERARPPASPCAPSATNGARRPTPPTSPTRSWSCSPRTRTAGIHHLVNGLSSPRGPTGPRYVVARAGIDDRGRERPGVDLGARVVAPPHGASWRATPLPSGEPLRVVARRDGRLRAGTPARGAGQGVTAMTRAAVRRCPASATAPSLAMATRAASFRELWRAGDVHATRRSSRPTCRPRRRGVLRGLHCIAGRTTCWVVAAGRALRRPRRPPPDARRHGTAPARRDRASSRADDWVVIPTGRRPRLPRASTRSSCIYLVTNEYDGVGRARLRAGTTRPSRSPGQPSSRRTGRASDHLRARRREPAAGRPAWCACAHGGHDPDRTTAPHRRSAPTADPKGLAGVGTIPRLSRPRSPRASLTRSTSPRPVSESHACASPSLALALALVATPRASSSRRLARRSGATRRS